MAIWLSFLCSVLPDLLLEHQSIEDIFIEDPRQKARRRHSSDQGHPLPSLPPGIFEIPEQTSHK
jgi:hypothetical protein